MPGIRSKSLTPAQRDELAKSFAATLADDSLTDAEAKRLELEPGSYKSLRGRWEARGRRWADEGDAPVRPAVARALEREDAGAGESNGKARAPRASKGPAGAALVPYIIMAGDMLTSLGTVVVGKLMKATPEELALVCRPDEEGRAQMRELAPPLAEYLDKRLGGASPHMPLIAFGLAVGGGVCMRAMTLSDLKKQRPRPTTPSAAPIKDAPPAPPSPLGATPAARGTSESPGTGSPPSP